MEIYTRNDRDAAEKPTSPYKIKGKSILLRHFFH